MNPFAQLIAHMLIFFVAIFCINDVEGFALRPHDASSSVVTGRRIQLETLVDSGNLKNARGSRRIRLCAQQDWGEKDDKTEARVACWNPSLRRVIGSLASVGALETAYLTYNKLSGSSSMGGFCSELGGGANSCTSVLNGPYAVIPGTSIPLAVVGLIAYGTVAFLALGPTFKQQQSSSNSSTDDHTNRIALASLTTAMGVFSVFLLTLLFGVLKESCPFCVLSAALSISMAGLSWLGGVITSGDRKGATTSLGTGLAAFGAAMVLFLSNDSVAVGEGASSSSSLATAATDTEVVISNPKGEAPPTITATSSPQALTIAAQLQKLDTNFYGAFWCGHCFDQKQALGKQAMSKIPYIECSKDGLNSQTALCKEKDVPGYPTWEIAGKLYPGEQTLEELEGIIKEASAAK